MSIFGGLLIAFRRRRRAAGAVDDRHVLISALGVLAGPGLPDFAGSTRRTADERDPAGTARRAAGAAPGGS